MTTPTIYDHATTLGPEVPFHLTPCGLPIGRGRVYLTAEQLARLEPFHIDGFAGGGGASEGYYLATGRHANMAWNHDREALAMHRANHPFTDHFREDIRRVEWRKMIRRLVTSAWFSPDCKDFSKAKGGKPKSKRIRGLAWTIIHMINQLGPLAPLVLYMENVEEFAEWCQLLPDGRRNPKMLGYFFKCFVGALRRRGYNVEWRELRASENSRAPTIRKRLYIIARRDNQPIVWSEHLFGEGKPNRAGQAADILDFTLPCPSIFMTRRPARAYTRRTGIKIQRPLAKASLQRFADGVWRYTMNDADPFLVCLTHEGNDGVEGIREPVHTVTGAHRGERALAGISLAQMGYGECKGQRPRSLNPRAALGTAVGGGIKHAVVSASLAYSQHGGAVRSVRKGVHTIAASPKDQNQLLEVHLVRQFGTGIGCHAGRPAPTVMSDGGGKTLLASTFLARTAHGERDKKGRKRGRGSHSVKESLGSVTGSNDLALANVFLAQNNGGMVGHDAREGVSTVNGKGANQSFIACQIAKYFGNDTDGQQLPAPLHTVTCLERFGFLQAQLEIPVLTPELAKKARRVARFLRRHGVKVEGEFAMCGEFVIVDIGMRMLTARELYRAQGFGEDYIIDRGWDLDELTGKLFEIALTKTAQVKMCGNSVCPPMAEILFRLNLPESHLMKEAA